MSLINVRAPDGSVMQVESNDDVQAHGVNELGQSLGIVPIGSAFALTPAPPPGAGWVWRFDLVQWTYVPTLASAIEHALADIDSAAGAARLRYITDVAGQQATYIAKAAEAQAYIDAGGVPGAYLQAEADAMGGTLLEAAQSIVVTSNLWGEVVGPAIEKARRIGKIDVGNAATLAQVAARRQASLANLETI